MVGRHSNKIEGVAGHETAPDTHALGCQINCRKNSQTKSDAVRKASPGKTEVRREPEEEQPQSALDHIYGEIQDVNSRMHIEAAIFFRACRKRNR